MTTPERIWCQPTERRPVAAKDRKHAKWVRGNWKDHNSNAHGAREFVRADLHDATKAKLAKSVAALRGLLRFAEKTESELGIILGFADTARALLAEIEKV